jgi:hypothetical protein
MFITANISSLTHLNHNYSLSKWKPSNYVGCEVFVLILSAVKSYEGQISFHEKYARIAQVDSCRKINLTD